MDWVVFVVAGAAVLAGAAAVLVAVGAYALLTAALRVSTRQRETHGSVF